MKVVFVGDEPSRLNTNPDIAFVGSRCWKTLLKWVEKLSLDVEKDCLFFNSHTEKLLSLIEIKYKSGCLVVALGENAHKRLKANKVKHFKLPHPSGLNRTLNDKEYVDKCLKECYTYIWGEDTSAK